MSWQPLLMVRLTGGAVVGAVVSSSVLFDRSCRGVAGRRRVDDALVRCDQVTARRTASLAAYWSGWSSQ